MAINLQSFSEYKLEVSCLNTKNNKRQQAQHDMTPDSRKRNVYITRKCGHNFLDGAKLLDTIMSWNQIYTGASNLLDTLHFRHLSHFNILSIGYL